MIAKRQQQYQQLWQRRIAGVYHSSGSDSHHVNVYAFRPTWKFWAPARAYFVYLTGGLSDLALPEDEAGGPHAHIELSAYARTTPGFGIPQQDEIAKWLHAFAQLPFQQNLRINPGDTFNAGKPLATDSEMSAFYFAPTPFVDQAALLKATLHAEAVAHVIPISEAERTLAERDGSAALVEAFKRAAVEPVFDLQRRSSIR